MPYHADIKWGRKLSRKGQLCGRRVDQGRFVLKQIVVATRSDNGLGLLELADGGLASEDSQIRLPGQCSRLGRQDLLQKVSIRGVELP